MSGEAESVPDSRKEGEEKVVMEVEEAPATPTKASTAMTTTTTTTSRTPPPAAAATTNATSTTTTTTNWGDAIDASDRANAEAILKDLEEQVIALRQERDDLQKNHESQNETVQKLQDEVRVLTDKMHNHEKSLAEANHSAQLHVEKFKTMEQDGKNKEERMDRLRSEADSLREEISRLSKSNAEYMEQISKMETKSKLGDTEVIPLRYQVQRLQTEVDTITKHSQWLESQLQSKTEQIASLQASKASELAQLRSDLDRVMAEKEMSSSELASTKQHSEKLQNKVEKLSKDLLEAKQEATDAAMTAEQSLIAERRVITAQKEQLERVTQRHDLVVKEMESLKALASEANEDSHRQLDEAQRKIEANTTQIIHDQEAKYKQQINDLQKQLEEADRRRIQAEDGFLNATSPRKTRQQPLALRDSDEPMNLTELHSRLAEMEDELKEERTKRKKAELLFARVRADIEASAPQMLRQRQEYELAMQKQAQYKDRLDTALGDIESYRNENSDLGVEVSDLQKANNELDKLNQELAKQVQALLKSKAGADPSTFEGSPVSIEEMQSQNQRLLQDHQRLNATITDLKRQLETNNLKGKLQKAEDELSSLQEDRKQQQQMIQSIVQQRDLYRALLAKQDSSILGNKSEESSALELIKDQTEKSKGLQLKNRELETELDNVRTELAALNRDKEIVGDRLARYEAHSAGLTESLDNTRLELSKAKADAARHEAAATFHREKCTRAEEALQRTRDELNRVNDARNRLQQVNDDLQKSLSTANADVSRLESDLIQMERKCRLAETQAETARLAEKRITDEATQLRNEVAKQGTLLESVHRIESGLAARNEEEKTKLAEDLKIMKERQITLQAKYDAEVANLSNASKEYQEQIKEIESEKTLAVRESLGAKKQSLELTSKVQDLTKKCATLESQLRIAKKKLGEEVDSGEDKEAELNTKIEALNTDLDAAKSDLETWKKRASTFEKLSKDNEKVITELNSALKGIKDSHEKDVESIKNELEATRKESKSRQEIITELTNDLSSHREERDKATSDLKNEISTLQATIQKLEKDMEAVVTRSASLEDEVVNLRVEVTTAQNNYERELGLHSTARTALRAAREQAEAEVRLRNAADEKLLSLRTEYEDQKGLWVQEKSTLENDMKKLEQSVTDSREQAKNLFSQLDTLNERLEKYQTGKADSATTTETESSATHEDVDNLRTTLSELREVVKFLRSEREMLQANLDSARRTAERDRASMAVLKRNLDEARAELNVVQASVATDSAPSQEKLDLLDKKLKNSEEKCRLLGDSNNLLREEAEKLQKSLSAVQNELMSTKSSIQPFELKCKELEIEKTAWTAEKESLKREIDDWKGRVQSLVSKFNQIDPGVHAKALKEVEDLQKAVEDLKKQKTDAEEETKRIRQLASRVSKELTQQKTLAETQKKTIARLASEKETISKNANMDTAAAKERDELKQKVETLEKERASEKLQLDGANERCEKLRERLRQFQKLLTELRRKEANLTSQLKQALSANQKDDTKDSDQNTDSSAAAAAAAPMSPKRQAESPTEQEAEGTEADEEPPASAVKELPKVPPGGFKFAPSEATSEQVPTASVEQSQPSSFIDDTTKLPSKETNDPELEEGSKKRQRSETPEDAPQEATKRVATEPAKDDSTTEATAQPSVEQTTSEETNKDNISTVKKPLSGRRLSGERKELSMKEKLLEKKRKLQMAMAKKQANKGETKAEQKDAEGPSKKTKVEGIQQSPATGAPVAEASKATESAIDTPPAIAEETNIDGNDDAQKEAVPAGGEMTGEGSKEKDEAAEQKPASTAVFGIEPSDRKMTQTGSNVNPSALSGGVTSFGVVDTSAVAKPVGPASGSAFGGAFLNIKPPNSSSAPPAFTFGTSGSIKLPMPASKSPQNNIFNAFSTSNKTSFGGGGSSSSTVMPLFASTAAAKEEKQDDAEEGEEQEDGEMQDPSTENSNA